MFYQKNKKEPLVSILMNCYNGENYIKEAIQSVLDQEYNNWELVIWDNKSTDDSAKIIKSFQNIDSRIKYYLSPDHENLGIGRANAWPFLNGKYLAILDTDDLFKANKLSEQVKSLENSDYGISISNTEFFKKNKKFFLYKSPPPTNNGVSKLIDKYYISLESVLISLEKTKKYNISFDKNFSHISDFDLIIRLCNKVKITYVNKVLSSWRIHEESQTWLQQEKFYIELIKWCLKNENNEEFSKYFRKIKKLKKRSINRLFAEYVFSFNFNNIKLLLIKHDIYNPLEILNCLLYLIFFIFIKITKRLLLYLKLR